MQSCKCKPVPSPLPIHRPPLFPLCFRPSIASSAPESILEGESAPIPSLPNTILLQTPFNHDPASIPSTSLELDRTTERNPDSSDASNVMARPATPPDPSQAPSLPEARRNYPAAGTLVVVQGVVHTSDVSQPGSSETNEATLRRASSVPPPGDRGARRGFSDLLARPIRSRRSSYAAPDSQFSETSASTKASTENENQEESISMREISQDTLRHTFTHPKGPPFATQFVQIILVVMSRAAFEDIRSKGLVQPNAGFTGHSLGANSLPLPLSPISCQIPLVDILFYRGLIMQHTVECDEQGRPNYAMRAVNPILAASARRSTTQLFMRLSTLSRIGSVS